MRIHKILILLFFAVILKQVYAQNVSFERKIFWTESVSVASEDIDNTKLLFFEGAVYEDNETLLPYYFERIPLPTGKSYGSVTLENIVFSDVNDQQIFRVKHINNITEQYVKVSTSVQYERKEPYLIISFIPLKKSPLSGKVQKINSFTLKLSGVIPLSTKSVRKSYAEESVLNTGTWLKMNIYSSGIYKVAFEDLLNQGFSNIQNISIYGRGGKMLSFVPSSEMPDDLTEIPIYINKGSDGIFNSGDYVLFYGEGPTTWKFDSLNSIFKHTTHLYSDHSSYFITDKNSSSKLISKVGTAGSETMKTSTFSDFAFHELDESNLIKSGRLWLGEHFDILTSYSFNFTFPDLMKDSPVVLSTAVYARSTQPTSFSVTANGQIINTLALGSISTSYTSTYADSESSIVQFYSGSNQISLTYDYNKPANANIAEGWIDYLTLNVRRKLKMYGSQMHFRDPATVGMGNIAKFSIEKGSNNLIIWDITDPLSPIELTTSLAGSTVSFITQTEELKEFIAFDGSSFLSPSMAGIVQNQNLHGTSGVDFIIVCHQNFLNNANQLADFHESHDGLSTLVVTNEQVYNEFSGGVPDVSAIRNFMKVIYDNAATVEDMSKYLLLFGDGSFDNKSNFTSNSNYVLTYQSPSSLKPTDSYVTDDYFAILDDGEGITNGLLDIGVGRFPVRTTQEAQTVVNKIIHYATDPKCYNSWRNVICFVGDDEDGNMHMNDANRLAIHVDTAFPVYNVEKIFLDAYPQIATPSGQRYPDAKKALNDRFSKGALIISYTGHGSEVGLAHEQLVDIGSIMSWNNYDGLTLMMTATCEFSRFDDYERTSAGELVLLNPKGGAVSLLSTSRLVYASPNFTLSQNFYKCVLKTDEEKEFLRLGDIMKYTKNNSGTGINKRNFTLLGDPALKLAYPEMNAVTNSIEVDNQPSDTIKALSKVTVKGYVTDKSEIKISNFNGVLYPSVYDKYDTILTLANDGGSKFRFSMQNHILYKGKSSIVNGEFSFTFIVPKDISYRFGNGKISYYFENTATSQVSYLDGNGYTKDFTIGGSEKNSIADNTGPEIDIFMNNEDFVFGGITDENPLLLVLVQDSSGINTVGNGIGHDITSILDENSSKQFVLNDYYEAEIDNYQKGRIEYPMSGLSEGSHRLKVKIWDVNNNSTEDYIEFIVASSSELVLENIFNYPNPFTTNTDFYFDHNQANAILDVIIQVFTVNGNLVKTLESQISSEGFRSSPIHWDGFDDFGDRIGKGVYVYKVKVRSENGDIVEKYEKLVLLK